MYNPNPKFTELASGSVTINSPSTAFGKALLFSGLPDGRTFGLEFHDATSVIDQEGVIDIALTSNGKPGADDVEDVVVLRVGSKGIEILKRQSSREYQSCGVVPFSA